MWPWSVQRRRRSQPPSWMRRQKLNLEAAEAACLKNPGVGWWLLMLKRKFSLSFFIVWAGRLEDVHICFLTLIHVVSLPSIQVIVGRENFDRKGRRCGIGAEGGCNVSCLGHLNLNYSQWRVGILCETYLSIQHIISYYYIVQQCTAHYLYLFIIYLMNFMWTSVNYGQLSNPLLPAIHLGRWESSPLYQLTLFCSRPRADRCRISPSRSVRGAQIECQCQESVTVFFLSIHPSIYLSGKRMRRSTSKAVLLVYALDFLWVCWPINWVEFLVSTLLDLWKHIDNLKHLRRHGMLHKYGHPQKKINSKFLCHLFGGYIYICKYVPQKRTGWRIGQRKICLRFICLTSIYWTNGR